MADAIAVVTSKGITLTPLAPYPFPPAYLLTIDSANILLDCGSPDAPPEFAASSSHAPPTAPTLAQRLAAKEYLQTLRDLAPTLHLVLLTHPLVSSLGLLPWLRARCGLRAQVYATLPTREMGKWAIEEWVEARSEHEKNEARTVVAKATAGPEQGAARKKRKGKGKEVMEVDEEEKERVEGDEAEEDPWDVVWKVTAPEIAEAFRAVTAVRFTQPVHLTGPLKGYTLVAHRAGHTLGGTLYTLRPSLSSSLSPAASSSSLLYAPMFNHIKEHHLDGAALLSGAKIEDTMRRMGVVVVGAERSSVVGVKRVEKEKALLDLITSTLHSGSSLLLPTDPSARLLELLVLLERHWTFAKLGQRYPLVLVSRTGKDVIAFVRSLTEWMGGDVKDDAGGVLRFGNLRIYPSLAVLSQQIPASAPKLILTVPATLSHGPARELFVDFARQPGNVVILTGRGEEGSLGRWLWSVWEEKQKEGEKWGQGKVGRVIELEDTVSLNMKRKIYLSGDELAAHEEAEQQAADALAKRQALLERSRRVLNEDADSDSDSDASSAADAEEAPELDFEPGRLRKVGGFEGGAGAWDEFLDEGAGKAGANFDIFVKGAYAKRDGREGLARFRMFPVVERKRRVDAYGEAIDVEGWLRRGEDDNIKRLAGIGGVQAQGVKREREDEAEAAKPEPPHKYVVEEVDAHLMCSLFVVDLEGRADGRALKTILPQINPRKLVIVDGSPSSVADLANACRNVTAMTKDIFTPDVGQCITVGEETKSFSIRLGDTIMASLRMSRVEDYDVAYVSGVVHFDVESNIPVLERATITEAILPAPPPKPKAEPEPVSSTDTDGAAVIPTGSRLLAPLEPSLFIGDLRLTLLKDRLKALSVPSEFAGEGVLVCGPAPAESFAFVSHAPGIDPRKGAKAVKEATEAEASLIAGGKVAVKKVGRGRLVLEGSPGETFHVVRKVVYSMHAHAG